MSVISLVYDTLKNDTELKGMLSKHDLDPSLPALYERWAIEDIPMPYIVITWNFNAGDQNTKSDSSVIFDIFTEGNTTIEAEKIRNRLMAILDYNIFHTDTDGPIRTHYQADGNIPEPEDNVCHWNIVFRVIYWDKQLIEKINQRG